ncbi:uncharacterized protein LOC142334051 [Lycorma delicatula]|uniref:uncharacterized protein LOC142334051 n=1 Tax=Lycorma delicatula TaxID=130591 RepID=UPI003F510ECA
MKAKKAKIKKKGEIRKYREWERKRRNRLNVSFYELNTVLPDYDPAITRTKVDIINNAAVYIKQLIDKNQQLMEKNDCNNIYVDEITQLKKRVTDLTHRCRQLVDLLKKSNISVPAGLPPECFVTTLKQQQHKWTDRIKPEMVKDFLKIIKKNKENTKNVPKAKEKKDSNTTSNDNNKKAKGLEVTPKLVKINIPTTGIDSSCMTNSNNNNNDVPLVTSTNVSCCSNVDNSVTMPLRELNSTVLNKTKNVKLPTTTKNITTVPSTSSISLVLSDQISKAKLVTAVTKSNLLTTPIMATGIQTLPAVINRNPTLQNLGPGTLILSDGRIVNVPPPSTPTVIAAATTQFIVNRPVNPSAPAPPPAVIVIPNSNVTTTSIVKSKTITSTLSSIKLQQRIGTTTTKIIMPKPCNKKDATETTYTNKVPISALSSHQHDIIMNYKLKPISNCSPTFSSNNKSNNNNGKGNKNNSSNVKLSNNSTSKESTSKKVNVDKSKSNQNSKSTNNKSNKECHNKNNSNVISTSGNSTAVLSVNSKITNVSSTLTTVTTTTIPCDIQKDITKKSTISSTKINKNDSENVSGNNTKVQSNSMINANNKRRFESTITDDNDKLSSQVKKKCKISSSSTTNSVSLTTNTTVTSTSSLSSSVQENNTLLSDNNNLCNNINKDIINDNKKINANVISNGSNQTVTKVQNNCKKYSIDALCCKNINNSNNNINHENVGVNTNECSNEKNECNNELMNTDVDNCDVIKNDFIHCDSNATDQNSSIINYNNKITLKNDSNEIFMEVNDDDKSDCKPSSDNKVNDKDDDNNKNNEFISNCKESTTLIMNNGQVNNENKQKEICHNEILNNDNILTHSQSDGSILKPVSTITTLISSCKNTTVTSPSVTTTAVVNSVVDEINNKTNVMNSNYKQSKLKVNDGIIVNKNKINNDENISKIHNNNNIASLKTDNDKSTAVNESTNNDNGRQLSELVNNNNKNTNDVDFTNSPTALCTPNYLDNRQQEIMASVNNNFSSQQLSVKTTVQSQMSLQQFNQNNRDKNVFLPINNNNNTSCIDDVRLSIPNSEFSNDLFTSLQVPSGSQHPESLSPTAAFLLAFPLVSTSKTSEMLVDNDNSNSQHPTPTTILQIGNIDPPGNDLYHHGSTTTTTTTSVTNSSNNTMILDNNNTNNNHDNQSNVKGNEINKNKSIQNNNSNNNKQNNYLPASMSSQFSSDNRYTIDNTANYVSASNICYNNNGNYNSNSNIPIVNNTSCSNSNNNNTNNKGNSTNFMNTRHINKQLQHRDKQTQQNNTSLLPSAMPVNINQHDSIYVSSCNDKKKNNTTGNNSINQLGNTYDAFMIPSSHVVTSNSDNIYHHSKMFDHRNIHYPSSTSCNTTINSTVCLQNQHKHTSSNNLPLSITGSVTTTTNSLTNCTTSLNRKNNTTASVHSDIVSSCTYTQAVSSASSSVSLSSHSYSYNLFPNCNDFPLNTAVTNSHLSCNSVNSSRQQPLDIDVKVTSSNLNIFPGWAPSSNINYTTSNFNCTSTTFSSTYPSMSTMQKSCSTQTVSKDNNNNNFTNVNTFTTHQDVFNCPNEIYKTEKPTKKSTLSSKITSVQPRPPVNWMTTPDLRPSLHDVTPSTLVPEMMFLTSQKDVDFTTPNINNCNNLPPSFGVTSNNTQPFYGLDIPLDLPNQFTEITNTMNKSTHRLPTSSTSMPMSSNQQTTSHHYSWSPSKSTIPLLSHLDTHSLMIPSTLPTLVGDLALGTNTGPSTPATDPNIRSFNIPPPAISLHSVDDNIKSNRFNQNKSSRHDSNTSQHHHIQSSQKNKDNTNHNIKDTTNNKDCVNNSNVRNTLTRNTNNSNDYCNDNNNNTNNKIPNQTHQSTNTSGSFLSVSQLVDQAKTEGRNVSSSTSSTRKTNKSQQSNNNKQNNNSLPKRNSTINQQQNENKIQSQQSHITKLSTNLNNHNNYVNNNNSNTSLISNRKLYMDNTEHRHDYMSSNFPAPVNQSSIGDMMTTQWHHNSNNNTNNKQSLSLSSAYKGGNYSAESLIGMNHDHHDAIPTFSSNSTSTNQFGHHNHVHHHPPPPPPPPPHHHGNHHTHHHGYNNHQIQKPYVSVDTTSLLPVSSTASIVSTSISSSSTCPPTTTSLINPEFHTLSNNMVQNHSHHHHHHHHHGVEFTSLQNSGSSQQQTPSYQNCFNFTPSSTQNTTTAGFPGSSHSVGVPFLTDNDYQFSCLDTSYLFTHPTTQCPPSSTSFTHHTSTINVTSSVPSVSTLTSSHSSSGTTNVSLSAPIISTSTINSTTNRNCQTTQNHPTSGMNKLTNTSSASITNVNNKTSRKRKDESNNSNNNFSLLPSVQTSLPSSLTSSSSSSIYTSSYLHSAHSVNYGNPINGNTLPPTPRAINNYQPSISSALITTISPSCSSLNQSVVANHPSTTTLTNFNLSTIFPEINDKQRGGHTSNFLGRDIGKHSDIITGNNSVRNHSDYLQSLRSEFNNVIPPQIGAPVNPPLPPPHFTSDSFISSATFTPGQQEP